MPDLNLPIDKRNALIIRVICFFWIIAKIIGWKLWLADRLFPVVPVWDFLFAPSFVHLLLFLLSITCLLALLVYPGKRSLMIGVLIIEVLSCLLDQNRWQPWEFQYCFMLVVFIINCRKKINTSAVLGFILAAMYFYSGVSKINPVFIHEVWYKIILTDMLHVNNGMAHQLLIYHAGYVLGLVEIMLSIGLFFQRTKRPACLLLLFMHLVILLMFGPWGINYDIIIWPWNIALMLLLVILILKDPGFSISSRSLLDGPNKLFILVFGILPLLNLFGYWEYFFSSSLFSARPPDMYICFKRTSGNKALQNYATQHTTSFICDSNSCLIYVRDWAFHEMLVPENPEIRIYKNIKEQLEKRYPEMNATFITYTYKKGKRVKEELK